MELPQHFKDALARLDAEIDTAERGLAELKLKRQGAHAFLEYSGMTNVVGSVRPEARSAPATSFSRGSSPTATVWAAVQEANRDSYTMKDLINSVEAVGGQLSTAQITNSIHYLVRRKKMTNLRRGLWATTNAETPADTGVSDGNTPTSEEGGGSHEPEASIPPPSQAEDLDDPQLGTSIVEDPR